MGGSYNYGTLFDNLGRDLAIAAGVVLVIGFGLGWLVFG